MEGHAANGVARVPPVFPAGKLGFAAYAFRAQKPLGARAPAGAASPVYGLERQSSSRNGLDSATNWRNHPPGPSQARSMMLPLTGIKVVEIGQNLAGPYAGEILATLGADVIKIERPEVDDARGWRPPFWHGTAAIFHTVNRNKRGVTLDLKDARGVAWLLQYLEEADALLHNMRPGALEELGR